jgi:hypothetical protein
MAGVAEIGRGYDLCHVVDASSETFEAKGLGRWTEIVWVRVCALQSPQKHSLAGSNPASRPKFTLAFSGEMCKNG